MKSVAILATLALVATPAFAQSKPMSRADFDASLVRKYQRDDLNGDGKLTAEEWLKARPTKSDGTPNTIEGLTKSLAKRDLNKDGTTTVAEAAESEKPRFDKMDTNKDGMVTPEEKAAEPK
ncbi:MAG: hypothetical protein V4537_01465 [Pseudomonadota bacterium]